jgi:poly-gamma-glutamate capsule biosynthesis protein CapA/YwtB (metallophosphatase superfamily)
MSARILLTGDINLMNVANPDVPFRKIAAELQAADVVFGNLECCLHLPSARSVSTEGFFADPMVGGEALARSGIHAVGIANNVNYGAANIMASIARLDALGILHTGAGCDLAAARAPAIIARNGVRVGVLQRSSVYWPTDHEAHADSPGIAVLRGHTAYQVPAGRMQPGIPPANRPGVPPVILTWADAQDLEELGKDLHALCSQVDVVVASCHWGLGREPLAYMREIAHAAVEAGADIVIGHGPHYPLPVELCRGRPIFYGLGNLSFHTGHGGRKHEDWIGLMVELALEGDRITTCDLRLVRHNEANETFFRRPAEEADIVADLTARSRKLGAVLVEDDDRLRIVLSC